MRVSCGRNIGMPSRPSPPLLKQKQLLYGLRWLMIGMSDHTKPNPYDEPQNSELVHHLLYTT